MGAGVLAGAETVGVGAGSADVSARAADRGANERIEAAPSATAEIRRTLWVMQTSRCRAAQSRRRNPVA